MTRLNAVTLEVFKHLMLAIPEEMGANLRRTAFSPNIKERLDESCALFDAGGRLVAQAEHIPVHLGAMPSAVEAVMDDFPTLEPGDQIIANDPYRGGSHLPDVTLIAPIFRKDRLKGYCVNRAHHADMGGNTPGSMPGFSDKLDEEGIVIPPTLLLRGDSISETIIERFQTETRNPTEHMGDLHAQIGANCLGVRRCLDFMDRHGENAFDDFVEAIIEYSTRRVNACLKGLPDGEATVTDYLDGYDRPVPITVRLNLSGSRLTADFTRTSLQHRGNMNTPISVTRSAVYYVLRCLLPADIPSNSGCYAAVHVIAPRGSLLNPVSPAAVSSGNVETSQRIVDVLLSALGRWMPERIPAQAQGTMNNLSVGWETKTYYETIGGGMGASALKRGADAVQVHMTNTANTPVEVLESVYPVRVLKTSLRDGSGGIGHHAGGLGITKEILFLEGGQVSIQSERRKLPPKGAAGGGDARCGLNLLRTVDGKIQTLSGRATLKIKPGERITIHTPGGGGWGNTD